MLHKMQNNFDGTLKFTLLSVSVQNFPYLWFGLFIGTLLLAAAIVVYLKVDKTFIFKICGKFEDKNGR